MSRTFLTASLTAAVAIGGFFLGRWSVHSITNASLPPALAAAATTANPAPTPAAALRTAAETSDATPARALARLDAGAGSEAQEDERLRLLSDWAKTDPTAALDYASAHLKLDRLAQAETAIFTAWAQANPNGAWAWLTSHRPADTPHLDLVLGEVGKTDPKLAADLAATTAKQHPELGQELYLAAIQGMTYTGHFVEARRIIGELPVGSDADRSALVNFLAGQWARYQPDAAAAWIASLPPGPSRDEALTNLGESWSDTNPAQAADFALTLPPGGVRETNLRQAITKWLLVNPDEARSWVINSHAHEDFDQAVAAIATETNLMNREPTRALRWAETIFDDTTRMQSLGRILSTLATHDAAAAAAYIQSSSNLSPDQRAQLLKQIQPGGT